MGRYMIMKGETRRVMAFVALTTCIVLSAGCQSPSDRTGSLDTPSTPWDKVPPAQSGVGAPPPQAPPLLPPLTVVPGSPAPPSASAAPGPTDIPTVPTSPVGGATASGMHIERHDGFDRIVYDFGGTYAPSWRAEYVAEATQRGRATSLRIAGRSILQIYFFDTASSSETGIAEYGGPNPLSDPAAHNVVEVYLTPNFERGTQSFVGLRTDYPQFQVITLTEPVRIAVDIFD